MIARVLRPQIVNPMVLPLQNQRTIHTALGGGKRVLIRKDPESHIYPPIVLKLREYDLATRRIKTTLVARRTMKFVRGMALGVKQPFTDPCLEDTVALQPPKFVNVGLPRR